MPSDILRHAPARIFTFRRFCLSIAICIIYIVVSLTKSLYQFHSAYSRPDTYLVAHLKDIGVCDRNRYPSRNSLLQDRVTVLINSKSESRLPILRQLTYQYSLSPYIDAVHILWGNISSPKALLLGDWRSGGAPISVHRQQTSSPNDRFLPRTFLRTKSVLICDDDVSINQTELEFAFRTWQENQNRIVGFFPWAHKLDPEKQLWTFQKLPDRYSIMLSNLMIIDTEYLYKYSCAAPAGVKVFVDSITNCEDIAMNFLVAMESGVGPVLVDGTPRYVGEEGNHLRSPIRSRNEERWDQSACLAAFSFLFGGMKLQYSRSKIGADVAETALCEQFGTVVHCDSKAGNRYAALRAGGAHIIQQTRRYAYVTFIDSVDLVKPAVVLAQTLRSSDTVHDMVLMLASGLEVNVLELSLGEHFSRVVKVGPVENRYNDSGFGKVNAWLFEEYTKVVYLDCDVMVLTNVDHLFDHPEPTAAPDVYVSDKFNSGVLVLKPSKETYLDMLAKVNILPSYNKNEQGFLNAYFSSWHKMLAPHRLPARYNAILVFPPLDHPPVWFKPNLVPRDFVPLAIVHLTGPWPKPWIQNGTSASMDSNLWCVTWLKIASRLAENRWQPLDPNQLSVAALLPNGTVSKMFRRATLTAVPRWQPIADLDGRQVTHQQFLVPRTHGPHEAFVTVVFDEETAAGAAVWVTSFRKHHTVSATRQTLLLVSVQLANATWQPLAKHFSLVHFVRPIKIHGTQLAPEFSVLNVWNQKKGFDRLVFVHPLSIFIDNCYDLFSYNSFAAAPSVFPPDKFTPWVMVIQPNSAVFLDIKAKLLALRYSPDRVDSFLNAYFYDWFVQGSSHRLPSSYVVDNWFKQGLMKQYDRWKIVHFDERAPPWSNVSVWEEDDRREVANLWKEMICSFEGGFGRIKKLSGCGNYSFTPHQLVTEGNVTHV